MGAVEMNQTGFVTAARAVSRACSRRASAAAASSARVLPPGPTETRMLRRGESMVRLRAHPRETDTANSSAIWRRIDFAVGVRVGGPGPSGPGPPGVSHACALEALL